MVAGELRVARVAAAMRQTFFFFFSLCCWFLFLLWCAAINSTNASMRDIAMCAFFVCLIHGSIRSVCKTGQLS